MNKPTKPGYYWCWSDGIGWEPVRVSGPYPADLFPEMRDHGLWVDDTAGESWPITEWSPCEWGPEIVHGD